MVCPGFVVPDAVLLVETLFVFVEQHAEYPQNQCRGEYCSHDRYQEELHGRVADEVSAEYACQYCRHDAYHDIDEQHSAPSEHTRCGNAFEKTDKTPYEPYEYSGMAGRY